MWPTEAHRTATRAICVHYLGNRSVAKVHIGRESARLSSRPPGCPNCRLLGSRKRGMAFPIQSQQMRRPGSWAMIFRERSLQRHEPILSNCVGATGEYEIVQDKRNRLDITKAPKDR